MDTNLSASLTEAANEVRRASRLIEYHIWDRLDEMLADMEYLSADIESLSRTCLSKRPETTGTARRLEASRVTMAVWKQDLRMRSMPEELAESANALTEASATLRDEDVPNTSAEDANVLYDVACAFGVLATRAHAVMDAMHDCDCIRNVETRPPLWKVRDLVIDGNVHGRIRAAAILARARGPVTDARNRMRRAMEGPRPTFPEMDLIGLATRIEEASVLLMHGPYDALCQMMQATAPESPQTAQVANGRVTRICRLSTRRPEGDDVCSIVETTEGTVIALDRRDTRRIWDATRVSDEAIDDVLDDVVRHARPCQITGADFDEMVSADMDNLSVQAEYGISFPKRGLLQAIEDRDLPNGSVTYDIVSERIDGCPVTMALPRIGCKLPHTSQDTVALIQTNLPQRTCGTYELTSETLSAVSQILQEPRHRLRRLRRELDALPQAYGKVADVLG